MYYPYVSCHTGWYGDFPSLPFKVVLVVVVVVVVV
jgi:hypothetical protein